MNKDSTHKKIAFFGGAFDPIHLGHIIAAKDALEQFGLDGVYFIPAAQAPLKEHRPFASDQQRLDMIKRAIDGLSNYGIITDELAYDGPNYTIDTIRRLHKRWSTQRLFWIIGADQVEQLPKWHCIQELLKTIEFICIGRPGHSLSPPKGIPKERLHIISGHNVNISSTDVRSRINDGVNLNFILPFRVEEYIKRNHLYGA